MKTSRAFTLSGLLVVVTIIGILLAVIFPVVPPPGAIQSYVVETHHIRAKDMITAHMDKCLTGTTYIQLKTSSTTVLSNVSCSSSASDFASAFAKHFTNDGWNHPYDNKDSGFRYRSGRPVKGLTHIYYSGNSITIKTNSAANKYLSSVVLIE